MKILAVSDEVDEALLADARPERCADVRLIISCGDLPADYLEGLVSKPQRETYSEMRKIEQQGDRA